MENFVSDLVPLAQKMDRDRLTEEANLFAWNKIGLVTVWEVQSQAYTLILFGLVAFFPTWLTLLFALTWSLVAWFVFPHFRKHGMPDMLANRKPKCKKHAEWIGWGTKEGIKTQVAGWQASVVTLTVGNYLEDQATTRWKKLRKKLILFLGLVYFGITTNDHWLRKAGFSKDRAHKILAVGPFLNVPFRMFCSSVVINTALTITNHFESFVHSNLI